MINYKTFVEGNPDSSTKVLVICGTHGNEQNAIASTLLAREELNIQMAKVRKKYRPMVTFVVGWNETGIANYEREYIDGESETPNDLNRAFTPEGTNNNSKDFLILTIKELIAKHDIIIDVHNSPLIANCVLINNDLYAERYVDFCKKADVIGLLQDVSTHTIKYYGIRNDKFALTLELDTMGITHDNKEVLSANSLFIVHIIKQAIEYTNSKKKPDVINKNKTCLPAKYNAYEVKSHAEGVIWLTNIAKLGSYVMEGQVLATIKSYDGNTLETVCAPCDGHVCTLPMTYIMPENSVLFYIQPEIDLWGLL